MKRGVVRAVAFKKTAVSQSTKKKQAEKKSTEANERQVAQLILSHRENGRKLARSILRRWRVRMPADEIDSIVDLALCEAARRFSDEHGATFMTFLFYHLRGHLVRAVTRAAQASSMFMAYAQNNGIETGDWQYLAASGYTPFVPDHFLFTQRDIMTPEHELLRKERINQCRAAVTKLDTLEKEIVGRSFSEEEPLVDIARSLGYSRCHISRVKKTALDRLRDLLGGTVEQEQQKEETKTETALVERSANVRTASARRRSRRRPVVGRERKPAAVIKAKTKAA